MTVDQCKHYVTKSMQLDADAKKKALYYLTDEDYANERHAVVFFCEQLRLAEDNLLALQEALNRRT